MTAPAETWRVLFPAGDHREVSVTPPTGDPRDGSFATAWLASLPSERDHFAMGPSGHLAVAALVLREGWPECEILAPGELPRAAAIAAARADALREAAASEASEIAAREAAMRGTLAAPSLATMRALHRAGGCWLVSYDDDDTGDPVVTIEYLDGARALAEKEGDNPVRWVAVDRCGRVCLPPQPDAIDALIGGAS